MIVSTCIAKGHEFTTDEFIQTCPRCRSNMQVQMITEPKSLSTETRLLIAQQKQKQAGDAAFARYMGAQENFFKAQDDNAPESRQLELHDEYCIAEKNYNDENNRLADIESAIACLKIIEEIADPSKNKSTSFIDLFDAKTLINEKFKEACA